MKRLLAVALFCLTGCVSIPPQAITQKDGIYYHSDFNYQFSLPPGYQLVEPARRGALNPLALAIHSNKGVVAYNYSQAALLLLTANAPGDAPQVQQALFELLKNQNQLNDYLTNKINELIDGKVVQVSDAGLFSMNGFSCLRGYAKGGGVEMFAMLGVLISHGQNSQDGKTFSLLVLMAPPSGAVQAEKDFGQIMNGLRI